ncbi:hypothetical protein [Pedobacter psychrodurus]|uniref:hypothetical protein n=1 Tax=Pedobacter psychrodurus TaxID=2530456 RepID=UPI002931E17B|nr:hypothetical protein [Pedobacter psychrodurus]
MKNIVSNIKHLALSLLIVGLAIGVQSFKAYEKKHAKLAPFYYVNNGTNYVLFSDGTTPNVGDDCSGGDANPCAVQSTTSLTAPFPKDQWDDLGATRVSGSIDGTYTP